MKVYTYIITYPDGKIMSICGAVFESETAATDALYNLFDLAYQFHWQEDKKFFEMISRGASRKHMFNAYVLDFELAN